MAQNEKPHRKLDKFSLGFNKYYTQNLQTNYNIPYLSYKINNHTLGLYALFGNKKTFTYKLNTHSSAGLDYSSAVMNAPRKSLIGIGISHHYFPNPKSKIFNLYFENRISYTKNDMINMPGTAIKPHHSFEYVLSYGLKTSGFEKISFFHNLGSAFSYINNEFLSQYHMYVSRYSIGLVLILGVELDL